MMLTSLIHGCGCLLGEDDDDDEEEESNDDVSDDVASETSEDEDEKTKIKRTVPTLTSIFLDDDDKCLMDGEDSEVL